MSPKRGAENTVDTGLHRANRGKVWQNTQPGRNYEAMRKGSSAGHLFGRLKGESSAPPSFNVVTNIRGRKPKIEFSMASASTDNTQFTLGSTREPSFRFSCLCIRRVDTRKRSPASFPLLDTLRCSTYPTSPRTNRAGVHTSRLS